MFSYPPNSGKLLRFALAFMITSLYTLGDLVFFVLRLIADLIHSSSLHNAIDPTIYKLHPKGDLMSLATFFCLAAYIGMYLIAKQAKKNGINLG